VLATAVDIRTVIELVGLSIAVISIGWTVWQFVQESRERSAHEAKGLLRLVLADARTLVANLNGGEALIGIGPHVRAVLSRFEDPPSWTLLDRNEALAKVAVLEAWSSSPTAAPMIDASESLLRNAPGLAGGLSFIEPAAELLSRMATGRRSPHFTAPSDLGDPPEGTPTISQGLVGPLQYLVLQLDEKTLRAPVLESALEDSIPMNAGAAFEASGQHQGSLWLLRMIEVAVSEIERLPAKRVARLVAARPVEYADTTESDKSTSDVRERLEVLRQYEPGLAERLDQHVRRIDELVR
jgi:hypothetical protein